MKVLICDDDFQFAKKMEALLKQCATAQGISIQSEIMSDISDITQSLSHIDMAFLDVDMGNCSGIDLARELRRVRTDAVIIFVTNFIEYAPEGYEVQALRYLLKNQLEEKLPDCFTKAVETFTKAHQTVTITIETEPIDIPVSEILYLESEQRFMVLHLRMEKKVYRFYGSITSLSEKLEPMGFLRIHKSYLVNMAYIQKLQIAGVILAEDKMLPVSTRNYHALKERYLIWKGQNKWNIY